MFGGGKFAPNSKKYKGAPVLYVVDYETDGSVVGNGDGSPRVVAFEPEIRAIALPPDTETAVDITGASRVEFSCRTENEVRYGYESGSTQGTSYRTLRVGDEKYLDFGMGRYLGNLYFSCTVAVVIELEVWKTESLELSPTPEPEPTPTPVKLTGIPFGTPEFFDPRSGFEVVFDGNINTAFDSRTASFAICGLDFGAIKRIRLIRFHPRIGIESRSIGGKFEVSLDGTNYQLIHTIPQSQLNGWNEFQVNNIECRFLRFVSPENGFGNIAEIEAYGV